MCVFSFNTLNSILNATRILDPSTSKAKRVEQNTHMVSSHSHG